MTYLDPSYKIPPSYFTNLQLRVKDTSVSNENLEADKIPVNLQLLAEGTYQTEKVETPFKELDTDRYTLKRNLLIIATISLIAISIILGVLINRWAFTCLSGVVIPLSLWALLRIRRQGLRDIKTDVSKDCVEVIKEMTSYLQELRQTKMNGMMSIKAPTDEDLRTYELRYNIITQYREVARRAQQAKGTIHAHYQIVEGTPLGRALSSFVTSCDEIAGVIPENKTLRVVKRSSGKGGQPITSLVPAKVHPHTSVLIQHDTILMDHALVLVGESHQNQ